MKGTFIQLIAYGAENLPLMSDPEITFFKKVYNRHTHFSMESMQNLFDNKPLFNGISWITVGRLGDLVSSMYFQVTLPYDPMKTDSYWTNRIGFNLINRVELYIGKRLIDRLYGLWCHIWVELTHSIDKKNLINRLVGSTSNNGYTNGLDVATKHTLTIPLLFSFSRHKGLAIPLIALNENTDITMKFFFSKKQDCIQNGPLPLGDLTDCSVWIDYIFLEKLENLNIAQRPVEYLMEVTQHLQRNIITSSVRTIQLPFTLPCKELIWVVQNIKPYGDKFTDFTNNSDSTVKSVQFQFNSKNVFSSGARNYDYFNYIVPYQCHTGYPDLGINAYSFSLYPEQLDPSGIMNFSQLNNPCMNIQTTGNGNISIFSLSYNVLKIENGDGNMIYRY
jgi:hypothetical protein